MPTNTVTEPKFFAPIDKLPPANIEAEESILGGILLDPEAIARVLDILSPEVFSIKSHQQIYQAMLDLHIKGQPTDLMTVTTWLSDHNQLESVGGTSKIAQLVDRTISAVNIDVYAELVVDKSRRRKLITAGHQMIELGYKTEEDISEVFDQAEQTLFSISQERPQAGLTAIAETLVETFQDIESLAQGAKLPGVPTKFRDLDAMTGGLQRSDFIILAGRPSMGKTSLALNIAYNIATQKYPVAVFSLEMSKEQLVQRLLSSEAKIESHRLRSGNLRKEEWEPLSTALGSLSDLPLYIDDTANLTVNEMRSQARKLQSSKGELGLIMIDFLQLMEGGNQNRVQDLDKIARQLKGLARELQVPVMALSQLSRSVEGRNDKRPMMSDLRDSGGLEQTADLVAMLYRDEYYNPSTSDRGIAEMIITKHRNGPVGTVKLLFDNAHTEFRSMPGR